MRYVFFVVVALILNACFSCAKKITPEEIYAERKSGVVMILNKYYYDIQFSGGTHLYFTGIDADGDFENWTTELNEIQNSAVYSSGTGFFIGEDGRIMTNRHVVHPELDKAKIKNAYRRFLSGMESLLKQYKAAFARQYQTLESQKEDCYEVDYYSGQTYVDYEELQQIVAEQKELEAKFNKAHSALEQLEGADDSEDLKIGVVCSLGIAYDNTFVSTDKDFLEKNSCTEIKVSEKENVDLALIQLNTKQTPQGHYAFSFKETNEKNLFNWLVEEEKKGELTIDEPLYLIGYNAGVRLANTREGLKVQMTTGKVTQLPDGERLMYSIPALQGSSGSPILNQAGEVVAVNFAQVAGATNFNFGIPLKQIRKFLDE